MSVEVETKKHMADFYKALGKNPKMKILREDIEPLCRAKALKNRGNESVTKVCKSNYLKLIAKYEKSGGGLLVLGTHLDPDNW